MKKNQIPGAILLLFSLPIIFFSGPSLHDKRKDTFYIPLIKEQTREGEQKEVMMDVMNIRRSRDSEKVFITIKNLKIIKINEKGLYVGARAEN